MKFGFFLTILMFLLHTDGNAQDSLLQNIQVSLITCDPGEEVYSLFGHTAVRLFEPSNRVDEVYNYGTFNSYEDGFLIKFLRGKLPYSLGVNTYGQFLGEYDYFQRGVKEEVINLPNDSKVEFIKFLRNNALPENAKYMYDFFYDNCATRIQIGIDRAVTKKIIYPEDDGLTYRDMIYQYLGNWPWTKFGIDLIVASRADIKTHLEGQMFLPDHLSNLLGASKIEGEDGGLLGDAKIVLNYPNRLNDQKPLPWPLIVFSAIGIFLWLLYFSKKYVLLKKLNQTIAFILGIASLVIIFMWLGTDHQTTKANYNVIWLTPLYLLLPFYMDKKKLVYLLGALTILSLLPIFPQTMPIYTMSVMLVSLLVTSYMLIDKKIGHGV